MTKVPIYHKATQPLRISKPPGHIETTAMAWGIELKEARLIWGWLEDNVPPHQRARALTTILRRKSKT